MKREELKALEVPEDVIDKIMGLHGQDIERQKQNLAAERSRADQLQEQLSQRDTDLAELKKQAGESETVKSQLTELQAKYQEETTALQGKLKQATFDRGLELELVKAKARDTGAVRAMLDLSRIEQGEDGAFKGLTEQLESLTREKSWAFEGQVRAAYAPKAGETAPAGASFAEAIRSHYETPQG